MQFERFVDLNLDKGRAETLDLGPLLFEDDINSLKLGVRLRNSEGPVDVEGNVAGRALLSDGSTILIDSGDKEGNEAWLIVPQAALEVPGRVEYFLRVADTESTSVALYAYGYVKRTTTDTIYNPGEPLPDVEELRQIAADCVEATEDALAAVDHAVRYDTAQSLTNAQKKQARENIGAVGTDEMSAEFLCRVLFGNEDDWTVENYGSASFSATKTGRIITYKGNNNSNSGFYCVNLTGVPGAPHTARSGNFSNIALVDTDFVPIPKWLQYVTTNNTGILRLLGYIRADRYNEDVHEGYAVDYVLRRYNTETAEYEYTSRTTTPLGSTNTSTTANNVDKVSMAQIIPDFRGGDYVVDWSEWEEMAIFAIRRNRMFSGTVLLTPTYMPYGDQKPVVYSAEQTLEFGDQRQARRNVEALPRAAMESANLVAGKHPRLALETRNGITNNVTSIGNGETLTLNGTSSSGFVIALLGDYPLGTGGSTVPGAASLAQGPFDVIPGHTYRMRIRLVSGSYTGNNPYIVLYDTTGAAISGMSCSMSQGETVFTMDNRTQIGQYGIFFYRNTTYNNATFTMEWVDITDGVNNLAPQDTTKAGNQHAAGDLLTVGGTLYKTTQAIAAGETITPGTNVTETTVAAQLAERDTAIAAETAARETAIAGLPMSAGAYFSGLLGANGTVTVNAKELTIVGNHVQMHGLGTGTNASTFAMFNVLGTAGGVSGQYSEARVKSLFTSGYCYTADGSILPPNRTGILRVASVKRSAVTPQNAWEFGIGLYTYNATTDTLTAGYHGYTYSDYMNGSANCPLACEVSLSAEFIEAVRTNKTLALVIYGKSGAQYASSSLDLYWEIIPVALTT